LVLLAVLPALGLILYSASVEHQSARTAAEGQSLRVVKSASASYERLVEATRQLLMTTARLPVVSIRDPHGCSDRLRELLGLYPFYTNLGAATSDGTLFCSAVSHGQRINISDRSYFQRAQKDRGFSVGEYQIGRRTGKPVINFGFPIIDESGNVEAVVFAALDLAWLNRLAAETQLPANSILTVADERGTILGGVPHPGAWAGKTFPEVEIVKAALAQTEGVAPAIGLDGVKRFYGFTSVKLSALRGRIYLIVGIPADIALAKARGNLSRNLAGLLIVAIVSLAVAWWGGDRWLVRPVNALVCATEKLRAGDLSARSGLPHGENEVGRLALSFDRLATNLEEREIEVSRAQHRIRQNLERMHALHEIESAINSTLDLRAMLRLLLEKIDLALPDAVTTIRLINKETGQLEATACRNIDEASWRAAISGSPGSVTKAALERKIPITVANVVTDPRSPAAHFARRFGLVSFLGVPIIAKDEALGMISFFTKVEHVFAEEEIEFLSTLAGQVGTAIHNARLYAETSRREVEVSALYSITVATTQSLDLNLVLNEAIRKITDIFHFDATRIFLFNGDMSDLEIKAAFESKPEFWLKAKRFSRGESIVGIVAESGQRLIFEDVDTDPRYAELSTRKNSQKAGTHFLAMFPIQTKGKIWGTMACVAASARKLKPEEIALLEAMNNQIGIAVENATLYEQTAIKAKELSALYSIAGVASQSLDIIFILRRTMEKVLQIFGFDAGRIYLCRGETRDMQLVLQEGFPAEVQLPSVYRIGEGLIGKAVESGELSIVEDMRTDPMYSRFARNKTLFGAGFRASCLIPIQVRSEKLGVLNFLRKEPHHFSDTDLQLINAIAYHLGVAVGNAGLFSQIKQKSIELEKANKGKDEFLGIISHELRTPLNVIKGYTEILLDGALGEVNPEQMRALQTVANQSNELFGMINGILQVTKIESGAVHAASGDVEPSALLDELKNNYNIPYGKELRLFWDYPADLPRIKTDDEKFKGVLQNLINNAIKFTERGCVTISARGSAETGSIEFKIADTGIGIPRDKIQTIFDMFQQVDSSATRKYSGVGLGLYIVKKFTELLGGTVTVNSELGKGSVFTVTLPLHQRFRGSIDAVTLH
jgi:signal transduction histidine kinase